MGLNITQKLIQSHLVVGEMVADHEIGISIDQTLTQDATGTLVMLELEAMGLDRVQTEVSVQYVDHNLIQSDNKNPDDHLFLLSAAKRFGLWYSRAGNGVSHPLHMQHFGKPGKTLLGADSHTPAAGSLGMLAIGAGGLDVATAMAGEPFYFRMPKVWGVRLVGKLPEWVSAKDVILEMLRRHGVKGGVGRVIEYYGPGLVQLSAMDRHVLANMGAELGATSTVFPSDEEIRHFLRRHGREEDWVELRADDDATYDYNEEIDLSSLEPLIAKPTSPGNVVPVRELAGQDLYQAYIGSSANPGYRDFAMSALMVRDSKIPAHISFDINPASRGTLETLLRAGMIDHLIHAGARLHQAGCNGCIGMGQAPATGRNSLRTVPRNFPGRSGAEEDAVFLCSPETATASAMMGVITDPRELDIPYPQIAEPEEPVMNWKLLMSPLPAAEARQIDVVKGPNIFALPELEMLPDMLQIPILLKVGDDISTDEILPAGSRVLPYRSNIPKISEFTFDAIDPTYPSRAAKQRELGGHAVLGGSNYGQGSSREHAALAPRYLGLQVVITKSLARIHRKNLINYGVLPLLLADATVYDKLEQGDVLYIENVRQGIQQASLTVFVEGKNFSFTTTHDLSSRDIEVLLAGGVTNWLRQRKQPHV